MEKNIMTKNRSICHLIIVIYFAFSKACPSSPTSPNRLDSTTKGNNTVQFQKVTCHCRFLVPGNTQKILTEIWHHFWLNTKFWQSFDRLHSFWWIFVHVLQLHEQISGSLHVTFWNWTVLFPLVVESNQFGEVGEDEHALEKAK